VLKLIQVTVMKYKPNYWAWQLSFSRGCLRLATVWFLHPSWLKFLSPFLGVLFTVLCSYLYKYVMVNIVESQLSASGLSVLWIDSWAVHLYLYGHYTGMMLWCYIHFELCFLIF
jgi:hypothetical protein